MLLFYSSKSMPQLNCYPQDKQEANDHDRESDCIHVVPSFFPSFEQVEKPRSRASRPNRLEPGMTVLFLKARHCGNTTSLTRSTTLVPCTCALSTCTPAGALYVAYWQAHDTVALVVSRCAVSVHFTSTP